MSGPGYEQVSGRWDHIFEKFMVVWGSTPAFLPKYGDPPRSRINLLQALVSSIIDEGRLSKYSPAAWRRRGCWAGGRPTTSGQTPQKQNRLREATKPDLLRQHSGVAIEREREYRLCRLGLLCVFVMLLQTP